MGTLKPSSNKTGNDLKVKLNEYEPSDEAFWTHACKSGCNWICYDTINNIETHNRIYALSFDTYLCQIQK